MRTVSLPPDAKAAQVRFGVELETYVPASSGIVIGHYHGGVPVSTALAQTATLQTLAAPTFRNTYWKAERDGSIRPDVGHHAAEFVSPILFGDEGLTKLREFVRFLKGVGAKVNDSCGCHVTVSVPSIIGTTDHAEVVKFIRKLAIVAHHNAWAIYAQTGTNRHENDYSHKLFPNTLDLIDQMARTTDANQLTQLANTLGRGMVNFRKAFAGDRACIEFRAFAGTVNEAKLLHHVATAIGLMRYAHERKVVGAFNKSSKKFTAKTAPDALRRFWRSLGWSDANEGRTCATGLFGALHAEFHTFRQVALEMAEKFESKFPAANL